MNNENQTTCKTESRGRKFWRIVLGSMVGFVLAMIVISIFYTLFMLGIIASVASKDTTSIKNNSVLKLNLDQSITERAIDMPFDMSSYGYDQMGLNDILAAIKHAAGDSKIKGIYINSANAAASPASLKEIHDALVEFKKSGKFIYAYSDSYHQNGYYLATVADSVLLNPTGSVDLRGYAFQIMFYKGLLDKFKVDVQVVRHGQFKSAVEPYLLDKMSEANRTQMNVLGQTLWTTLANDIAAARKISVDTLNQITNQMTGFMAENAYSQKLVDRLAYASDAEASLRKKLNISDDEDINFVSISKYKSSIPEEKAKGDRIAVVYAVGSIYDGKNSDSQNIYSENFIKTFRKAYKSDDVKAIVLRINSPGGSALASENIWHEIEAAKKAGKIIVTSMGDYAASGGYYIACNSDYIIAQPNTLTGSIGVFGMIPSFQNALKANLGITIDVAKTHDHSDFGTGMRTLDQSELDVMQQSVESTYGTFMTRVANGRKMTVAQVDSIGQGRVWAGADAIKIGLVDQLGSIDDAINKAAELAGISKYSLEYYPKQQTFFELIFDSMNDTESRLASRLGHLYFTYQGLEQIVRMEGVQARLPFELTIQ
ncbi:MAG: signal peptide peptidase SppA [Bacteroidales bacterium]|nr:signal peptide peptidase SppA [Bacteroidales bacterium]